MRLIVLFYFMCVSCPLLSMENFLTPTDAKKAKTPEEVLPMDLWEACGNCCCRENDSNCPLGLVSSTVAACCGFSLATALKAGFSCSGLDSSMLSSCVKEGLLWGGIGGSLAGGSAGALVCAAADYAEKQAVIRERKHAAYLQGLSQLSPRSREAHIKQCIKDREKPIKNKID